MSGSVKVFSGVDINKKGQIASQYPAYYNENHVDSLQEGIESKERSLTAGRIPADSIPEVQERIKQEKDRLKEILTSRPNLAPMEKDSLSKLRANLGKDIRDAMFTYSHQERGTADVHEEARRMISPIIQVPKEAHAQLTEMGVKITNGRISRNQAGKAWKICGKLLGETTNVETLRRQK